MEEEELDLSQQSVRVKVIQDIKSEDNHNRKRDQQKRFDVYNGRQDIYILERLRREFSTKTVNEMRKIFSINLAKRIIDEKSSVYRTPPERFFSTISQTELSDSQLDQIQSMYELGRVNMALAMTNIKKNVHDQCTLMIVPDGKGFIKLRPISPNHYDVIPSAKDPEEAYAYVLNVWNMDLNRSVKSGSGEPTQLNRYKGNDRSNQTIADDDDRLAAEERYLVWTADVHFMMDGTGQIKGEVMDNPIGMLPFVDVADPDKDFQFFIRRGSGTIDFSLDYGLMLSDNANIIRLQGYSQAVIASDKVPAEMTIGPNHVLHLQLDKNNPELQPRFEFVTPSPDLSGAQEFLDSILSLFLTSEGQDPAILSTKGEGQKFQSGIDRLLAMISKFEATRDDFELFRGVEQKLLTIYSKWTNAFNGVTGDNALNDRLTQAILPDDVVVEVKFNSPEAIKSEAELEDSVFKRLEQGAISTVEAIMELRGVSEDKAIEVLQKIQEHEQLVSGIVTRREEEDGGTDVQEEQGGTED